MPAGDEQTDDPTGDPTAEPTDASTDGAPEKEAYEPPTFDVLEPTDNRPQPVVLLVGDGYADGDGASSAGTSFPSILASTLGWDVRLATARGAGYVGDPTLLELFTDSPGSVDPDLVLVQGGYGGGGGNDEVRSAVEELAAAVGDRYPDAHVVVLSPFGAGGTEETAQEEGRETTKAQERTVARTWREDPGVLVLRPLPEGWGDALTDEGHRVLGTQLVAALRSAGLAPAV